jgi:colanic acid/amylovoran biosynthesis protein
VYHPDQFEAYYRIFASTLDKFSQEIDAKVFIFNQVTGPTNNENDNVAAKLLLNALSAKQERIIHVDRRLNPMELKGCYRLMDMFIASRLHSGIFAMSSGVPTIFIGYNPKTRGMLKAMGLEQWMLDLDILNEEKLVELLRECWKNRRTIVDKIQQVVKQCQFDFERVSARIIEDYFNA